MCKQDIQLAGIPAGEEEVQRLGSVLEALDNMEAALQTAFLQPFRDLPPSFRILRRVVKANTCEWHVSEELSEQRIYHRHYEALDLCTL